MEVCMAELLELEKPMGKLLELEKQIRKRRFKRKTADAALKMVKRRIAQANRNADFIYRIDKAVAFGSYINSDKEYVGDLDIAVYYSFKGKAAIESLPEANRKRASQMGFKGSFLESVYYGIIEVFRYLKNGKQIISLHDGGF
jgi:predicted nucleotidyltransferase